MLKDKNSYRLLIIEDNLGDAVLIEDYLEECFSHVLLHKVETYQQARTVLQSSKTFDLILLDLTLPDLQGEELVVRILELAPQIPVVALTGVNNIAFSVKALQLGVSDYILKDELSALSLYKNIIHNIERKKYYLDLKSSEKRYNDLFHLSPQPMWVYELDSLRILDVNEAAVRHYGYTEEEFLGLDLFGLRPPEERMTLQENIEIIKNTRRTYGYGVYTHMKKDGSLITVEVHGNEMEYDGLYARIVTVNDITKSLKHTEAIQNQNELLREIAWIQSHKLRAPLSRMMGLLDVLKDVQNADDPEELKFCHEQIENSARELDDIIRTIVNKAEMSQEITSR
ncbi:PAS domain S-box protein [Zeaxanthinibacter enoshimensis]|uniref:histidine kinase n=1 Tax=Zeaxanthinibacter enoshimensis TaxID=392009 RepID=A0A4R6TGU7_9FLAO|nr:PAS domain S-box protein [Zeaxanthinibacter enoshimensis]TDQ29073.1 PAS domain S-box-containing protein [Zeaxanthinibacter enoshimensis]